MRNKIFSLLVLLMTAATGAWATPNSIVINGTPQVGDKSISLTYYFDPANVPGIESYAPTLKVKCAADNKWDEMWLNLLDVSSGTTDISLDNLGEFEAGKTYEVCFAYNNGSWVDEVFQSFVPAAPAIPVTDLGSGQWQFTMPAYAVVAKIEYDTQLALDEVDDNTAKLEEWDGYEADVTLTRTLQAGSWNTFAAPFDVDATKLAALKLMKGVTVKELSSASLADGTLTLTFGDASSIEAGKPYLVKVAANTDLSTAPFTGAIVSKDAQPFTSTDVDFIPTLGATTIEGSDTKAVLFLAADNKLLNPSALPADMKGFRAYFQLKGNSEVKNFVLDFGDGVTTGIKAIDNGQLTIDNDRYYDLQGRKVNAAQKGVYIQNGKKVIIK